MSLFTLWCMMLTSIDQIWLKVLQGEHEAWKELVFRYSPMVYSVARRTGLSSDDAEDCMQQTWLKLFDNRYKIKEPEKLPGWLVTTTSRKAFRMVKHRMFLMSCLFHSGRSLQTPPPRKIPDHLPRVSSQIRCLLSPHSPLRSA